MANVNQPAFNGNAIAFSFFDKVGHDGMAEATRSLPTLPSEMISEIAKHLDSAVDVGNLRLVNKRYCSAVHRTFMKTLLDDRTLYPRYGCLRDLLSLLGPNFAMGHYVRKITLIAEGMRIPGFGYSWGWEDLQNLEGIEFTDNDVAIINKINRSHVADNHINGPFINTGGYRTMLALILSHLPNLETIQLRKLKQGEHLPYWNGGELVKGLSFYKDDLNTNGIFYGDWQYDTIHHRVTSWIDEFGDENFDDDAGPQAGFGDDLMAAVIASGTKAEIINAQ
ncbi:hypothetical protein NX059_002721 [Plenodomus lindquistii]|nr:hypothetical protein NX059_002721 [Plenodomus lindquistii]